MKLLKTFLFVFVLLNITYGQTWYIDTTSSGKEIKNMVSTKSLPGFGRFPVQTLTEAILEPSGIYDVSDTVTTASDTLSKYMLTKDSLTAIYKTWIEFEVWADDTVEICMNYGFCPENTFLVIPNYSNKLTFPKLVPMHNIYIRRYNITGETGTPRWYVKIQGR